jgi:hypothetical protein
MKTFITISVLPFFLLAACSKKADTEDWGTAEAGEYYYEEDATPISEHLSAVQSDLEAQNYEDVANRLVLLQNVIRTREEEREYRLKVYEVTDALRQQAETDPQAKQLYHNFGRRMMGR